MAYNIKGVGILDDNRILTNIDRLVFDGGSINVGGPHTVNFSNAHYELQGGGSISFTNAPGDGLTRSVMVILTGTGFTWPASVLWSENDEPPQSSGQDLFEIVSYNGAYYGSMVVYNGV